MSSSAKQATHTYTTYGVDSVKLIVTDANTCKDTITKNNFIAVIGPTASIIISPDSGCRTLTVNFTDNSTTDGIHPITGWLWYFGDGLTSISQNTSHFYTQAGNFSPKLKVTDLNGCSDSINLSNKILITNPKANFSSIDTFACIGKSIIFNNTSSGIALTYAWSFGNGDNSVLKNPLPIAYSIDSNYSVTLVVTDTIGCKDTLLLPNYIKVKTAKASFTVNDSISFCAPFEVTFTNTSVNYISQLWSFGDGGTSTSMITSDYYSLPNTDTAKLVVTDRGGCKDSAEKYIQLYSPPADSDLVYSPLSTCSELNVNYHIKNSAPCTYLWDFGDGNSQLSDSDSVSHNYNLAGNFSPKVILTDPSGCVIAVQRTDTIHVVKSNVNFGTIDSTSCLSSATFNLLILLSIMNHSKLAMVLWRRQNRLNTKPYPYLYFSGSRYCSTYCNDHLWLV